MVCCVLNIILNNRKEIMAQCTNCNSEKVQSRGTRLTTLGLMNRFQCQECSTWFQTENRGAAEHFNKTKFSARTLPDYDKHEVFVISGIQNDTPVNEAFLKSLEGYCARRDAKLILMPIKFKYTANSEFLCDVELMIWDALALHPKLRLMANLPINPAIESPLSSLENMSKGDSLIVAGTTLQMSVMPTLGTSPAILHTTGSITYPNTTDTKQGIKSKFNHSFSALVVEIDDDEFHIRVLNGDNNNGFYDVSGYQSGNVFTPLKSIEALVMGDIHAANVSTDVIESTFTDDDSIVNVLRPKNIVLHDLHDHASESHHGTDIFSKFTKHVSGKDDVEVELGITADFLVNYIPSGVTAVIVESNHNAHLDRWLIDYPNKHQSIKNSKFYHKMMYSMLDHIDNKGYKANALELWLTVYSEAPLPKMEFTSGVESYKIKNVELKLHGDKGIGGARGSGVSFAKLPTKTITGHSHSPKIHLGNWTVGTSSKLNMGYNDGTPSTWMNAHCIIYGNGCRQMIFIINNKWKK